MIDHGLKRFVALTEERCQNLYGVLAYQHGRPVGEHHWVNDQHFHMFSLSKSFASTLIGIAIDEGLLRLTDRPLDILSGHAPDEVQPRLEKLTLRDMLMMASGHDKGYFLSGVREKITERDWPKLYMTYPFVCEPGTRFSYDTGDTYMASAMLQRVAGETMLSYGRSRLFEPLGIDLPRWDSCPQGVTLGGSGLYLTLADTVKLGLLYLQKGVWEGRRIVSERWVEQAAAKQIDNHDGPPEHDGHYGYGYQFWRCNHNAYRADGRYGQYCVVLPEVDAVVAIHARAYRDPLGILQSVWDAILPDLEKNR